MNEIDHSSTCERAGDLVSVLYGEAGEREQRDFELHLRQCGNCRAEFAAFAQVRESIGEWRDEALTGLVPAQVRKSAPVKKSALLALRKFFDLSPLWLKAAAGLAAVIFCVLAALALARFGPADEPARVAEQHPGAVYTKEDLDRAVQDAIASQSREQRVAEPARAEPKPVIVAKAPAATSPKLAQADRRARRPFSKAERDQLAAELRLLTSEDELDLDQFDDRINRQR